MESTLHCYRKYGHHAAGLAMIPGLAHFRSRQYKVGVLTCTAISVLLLWVFWLAILQFGSQHSNLAAARACFLLWTLVVWEASVFHAYYSTIRQRQQDGARQSVDLAVQISASGLSQFRASARTKNLSRTGACLVASNALPVNTQVTIAFDGHPIHNARVIWSKSTGNETGTLVGVEFARPLASLSRQRAA
ncbi:MAG: PilZ domain-containing protein [Acidobacteria bacterium]|nr:PilZ domain-containing protein [Acidobacteriota bacterium]MCI0724806.1 PilZ domain-containing protein [Acidobacteriota bacterium]